MRNLIRRLLVGGSALALTVGMAVAASPSASAYGAENWQTGFAGTGVAPGTGFGFGFWGWCAFAGGVTGGNTGDCQVSQYVHTASGGVNCEQSIDVTAWTIETAGPFPYPNFVLSGTTTTNPSSAALTCLLAGGAPPTFANFPTGIPGSPGHFNFNGVFGAPGELQIQVTQVTGPF